MSRSATHTRGPQKSLYSFLLPPLKKRRLQLFTIWSIVVVAWPQLHYGFSQIVHVWRRFAHGAVDVQYLRGTSKPGGAIFWSQLRCLFWMAALFYSVSQCASGSGLRFSDGTARFQKGGIETQALTSNQVNPLRETPFGYGISRRYPHLSNIFAIFVLCMEQYSEPFPRMSIRLEFNIRINAHTSFSCTHTDTNQQQALATKFQCCHQSTCTRLDALCGYHTHCWMLADRRLRDGRLSKLSDALCACANLLRFSRLALHSFIVVSVLYIYTRVCLI